MLTKFTPLTLVIATLLPITACGPRSESDWLGGYRPGWRDENAYPIGDRPRSQQEQWQRRQLGDVCCVNNGNPYASARERGLEYAPPEQVLSPVRVERLQTQYGGVSRTVEQPQYTEPVQANNEPSFHNPY